MSAPMESEVVTQAVKGDRDALAFLRDIALVLHVWDDLVDRDVVVTDAELFTCFWTVLVKLPENAFYRANEGLLRPVLINAIINWRCANELERGAARTQGDFMIAFIVRSAYVDLLLMSATIIGGAEWAVAHSVGIKRWAHAETFDGYLTNLATERVAREGV